jgi:nucleoside 2-deoxyribosyltransferase
MKKRNKVAYLAGAMESLKDEGLSWRRKFSRALKELHIDSVIPNDEERDIKKKYNLPELKKTDLDKYIEIIRSFIKMDLKFVETVDMLIVKWEGENTAGTIHEVGYAYQIGTPCYLVTSQPLHEVPGWFLSCFTKVFPDLDTMIWYLKRQ